MEAVKTLIPLLITFSLAGLVLAVGLHSTRDDITYVLRRPGQLMRAILAVLVLPPVIAGIVVSLLPIAPIAKVAIMLMAISPVPPLVPGKELAVGGRKEYAYGLYVAMALLTLISVPILFAIAGAAFRLEDTPSIANIVIKVFLSVIIPLGLGLLIRRLAPAFAEKAWSIIYKLSMIVVLVAIVPILITSADNLMELVGNGTLFAMGIVALSCLAIGHFLGGPDRRDRATLAIAASTRHPGIAIAIAGAAFADPRIAAAIVLYLLWGLVLSLPYTRWIKRSHLAQPGHA